MTDATITCRTASGKSLEELSKLVALRAQRLGELTKDAVIATAIDVLVSLRAETLDARKTKSWQKVNIESCAGLHFGFRHPNKAPCIRHGDPHKGAIMEGVCFRIVDRALKAKDAHIFRITPHHGKHVQYYLAARSQKEAEKYETDRVSRRIERKGGLAKTALGVAMAKLSTRNAGIDSPKLAQVLASNLSHVTIHDGTSLVGASGDFGLEYRDELNYAIPALKSGANGVETAIQKAANKIAGMITHAAHKVGDFEHDIPSPFPEVKRRK